MLGRSSACMHPSPLSPADMERRWPDRFWTCGRNPHMICSDSWFCNWRGEGGPKKDGWPCVTPPPGRYRTNNPQMWRLDWWEREHLSRFDKSTRYSAWNDIEKYMNMVRLSRGTRTCCTLLYCCRCFLPCFRSRELGSTAALLWL